MPRCLALAALVLWAAPAAADAPGRAYGTVTIADHVIRLTHAYVVEPWVAPEPRNHAPYVAGKFVVFLADRPLAGTMRRRFGAESIGYLLKGRAYGLKITFDRATEQATDCELFESFENIPRGSTSPGEYPFRVGCIHGNARLVTDAYALRGVLLTAAVRSDRAAQASGSADSGVSSLRFSVAFTAPVDWAPRYVATLDGEAARNSAPSRMYRDWLTAVARADSKGLLAGFADAAGRSGEIQASLARRRAPVHWPADALTANVIATKLEFVHLYEGRAVLVFAKDTPAYLDALRLHQIVPMKLQDGQWKLGE